MRAIVSAVPDLPTAESRALSNAARMRAHQPCALAQDVAFRLCIITNAASERPAQKTMTSTHETTERTNRTSDKGAGDARDDQDRATEEERAESYVPHGGGGFAVLHHEPSDATRLSEKTCMGATH